jgi:hypothetical protein
MSQVETLMLATMLSSDVANWLIALRFQPEESGNVAAGQEVRTAAFPRR